eukprot:scaffold299809_cov15-Tisochrysis_lutea.AAC.1
MQVALPRIELCRQQQRRRQHDHQQEQQVLRGRQQQAVVAAVEPAELAGRWPQRRGRRHGGQSVVEVAPACAVLRVCAHVYRGPLLFFSGGCPGQLLGSRMWGRA